MSFNSLTFCVFFTVIICAYYLIADRYRCFFLLLASYYFYMSWNANVALILLGSTAFSYICALGIGKLEASRWRKALFIFSVAVPAGMLLFYKYFNFISCNIADIVERFGFGFDEYELRLLVPLGISFYTFKIISYISDVYTKKIAPQSNFAHYALYVSFFPQIICGPIERAGNFLPKMQERHPFDSANFEFGIKKIILGFFKKLVIADSLAVYVNQVYAFSESQSSIGLMMAAFFFSIQIYCDFSGYTDIAIGISRMFGYDLMRNFNYPYFSKNFKEFWARWHISLSTWLRDYIYIPLGGSRCSKLRTYLNVMATFLISGLWHGANWTFVFWGALHGCFLIIQDLFAKKKLADTPVSGAIKIMAVFSLTTLAWVFFRASSIQNAFDIILGMFTRWEISMAILGNAILPFTNDNTCIAFFLTNMLFIAVLFANDFISNKKSLCVFSGRLSWLYYAFLLASTLLFGRFGSNGFIYAQF